MLSATLRTLVHTHIVRLHLVLFGGSVMPRYYFHLSAPDQWFQDTIGFELIDLSDAHLRAVQLARRVMMISGLARFAPDLKRWTVEVVDECQRSVMTVMFPSECGQPRARPMMMLVAAVSPARRHIDVVWRNPKGPVRSKRTPSAFIDPCLPT